MPIVSDAAVPKDLSRPLNVRCGSCQHVWAAGYLPLELSAVATLLGSARCPLCQASDGLEMLPNIKKT